MNNRKGGMVFPLTPPPQVILSQAALNARRKRQTKQVFSQYFLPVTSMALEMTQGCGGFSELICAGSEDPPPPMSHTMIFWVLFLLPSCRHFLLPLPLPFLQLPLPLPSAGRKEEGTNPRSCDDFNKAPQVLMGSCHHLPGESPPT